MIPKLLKPAFVATTTVCALAFSLNAAAFTGKVSRIYVNSTGVVHLRLEGVQCNRYWIFKLADAPGEAWYTLLLSAYHAGTSVHLTAPPCEANKSQYITGVSQNF